MKFTILFINTNSFTIEEVCDGCVLRRHNQDGSTIPDTFQVRVSCKKISFSHSVLISR